jgi:hypothetical protein
LLYFMELEIQLSIMYTDKPPIKLNTLQKLQFYFSLAEFFKENNFSSAKIKMMNLTNSANNTEYSEIDMFDNTIVEFVCKYIKG